VIEGVRLLPWLHETARSDRAKVAMLLDCDMCMEKNTPDIRRSMGCGYIPGAKPAAGVRPDGYEGEVTVCIGYSTKLPEVAEVSRARMWWDKGQLPEWCERHGNREPSAPLGILIEELEAQVSAVQAHVLKPKPGGPRR
jgi:hypothetical protein